MKFKKFIAAVGSILILAGNQVIFAQNTTIIEAVCDLPEISVTVPATGEVIINPYGFPVEIEDVQFNDQIVSTPIVICNESVVPVKVSATITGAIKEGSDMALSSTSMKDSTSTRKKAFIYFEIQPTNDPKNVTWDSEYNSEKHIIVRTTSKSKKNMVTLDAYDENGAKRCYGAFRITGDCVAEPKKGWTKADGIDVTIAFTFTPTSKVQ